MEKYRDIIIYATIFVTSFAFPLWVSTYAVKRGRPGWSKVAFFSTFVLLGFFGGLAALAAASLKPGIIQRDELEVVSDASIETPVKTEIEKSRPRGMCPKCNSNLVQRTVMLEDSITKERIVALNQDRLGFKAGSILILIGALIFGYTLFLFFMRNYQLGYLAAGGVGCYLAYVGARPWQAKSQEVGKNIFDTYACRRCRHTWDGKSINK
jgi:hypothetical protein